MSAYYNEIDPYAAAWLRNLIAAGHIAPGDVDERSIVDVRADDLRGYTQCHFFAGIGGWSLALRLAGWSDDRPVWSASCPCQPFSRIGKRAGTTDERHLWPVAGGLIRECGPLSVVGEQVASPDGLEWVDGVRADMEAAGYAFAAFDLCAAGVGAPHIRQRLYWVGHAKRAGLEGHDWDGAESGVTEAPGPNTEAGGGSYWDRFEALDCSDGRRRIRPGSLPLAHGLTARVGRLRAYGNAIVAQVAAEFIGAYMSTARQYVSHGATK